MVRSIDERRARLQRRQVRPIQTHIRLRLAFALHGRIMAAAEQAAASTRRACASEVSVSTSGMYQGVLVIIAAV